jgi:D-hexose-6-phosphate mutarotase
MSFKVGDEEILWSPKTWSHGGTNWCHGGIPLCWPWFGCSGPNPDVPHGFAWRGKFEVRNRKSSRTRSELVLGLKPTDEMRKEWPYDFDLEYGIVLADTLKLVLRTKNTGDRPFALTAGFHPYFFIGDRDRTEVTGTDGMKYCDSRLTTKYDSVWNGSMKLAGSVDHVFVEPYPTALHKIVDPLLDRRISVSSSGAARLVVWNPGVEEPAFDNPPPGQLTVGDWRHILCVEPAILWKEAAVEVKPGAVHELAAEIALEKGVGK